MTTLLKPRAILFDWDNTLVNTWPLIHTALNMTLRFMECPEWSYARVRDEVKQSMRDSFPAMFGERWKEAADYYQKSYRSIHLMDLVPLDGAQQTLKAIVRPPVFTGIVSNKMGKTLREELEHLQWGKYFDAAIGAGDAAKDKPHAEPVLLALKHSGIEPGADVWFVGDTDVDLAVAQATGCTPILYGDFTTNGTSYDGYPFAAHAKDHAALKMLLIEANCAA